MFKKQVLILATATGAGTKITIKDISDSMKFWGLKTAQLKLIKVICNLLNLYRFFGYPKCMR